MKKKSQSKQEAPTSAETPVMRVLNALGAEFRKRGKTTVVLNLEDGGQFVWFADDVMTLAVSQAIEGTKKEKL